MKKLFSKLFITYFIVILGLVALILVFSFQAIKKSYISTLESDLAKINSALIYKIKEYLAEDKIIELQRYIIDYGSKNKVRVTIIDTLGNVLADSEEDPAYMENHGTRIEVMKAIKDSTGTSIRHSKTLNKDMLYLANPVYDNNNRILVISRASIFADSINNLFSEIRNKILLIAGVMLLFSLILIYFISKSISKPIVELTDATRRMADGDFSAKVYLKTGDELDELAKNFNIMTDRLRESFEEIQTKQKEIASIVKSLRDAIIVIGHDDKILFHNKAFSEYFGMKNAQGKFFWEVIPNKEFAQYVNKLQSSHKVKVNQIEFENKYFLASGSINDLNNDVIIIFYDITEYKNLENVKKDFISNVSHELKTPLTAIKGFVETLKDNADGQNKHYLEIIDRQTQRLINIVRDLLMLSRLENPDTKLEKQNVDAYELVDNIFALFAQRAKDKGIELIKDIEPGTEIKVDEYMFEQVLINLIENALNHTDEGYVKVKIREKKNHSIIKVEDTGKGIAQEHQQRIFERFYTVEKSRSRAFAGTGLGLSIVKHIVSLHNGEISLESTPGKGSVFIIKI